MTTPPTERFAYVEVDPSLGAASALPYVPIVFGHGEREMAVSGLVDSGTTLNVLSYDLGLQLGAVWEQQTVPVALAGNLTDAEARAIVLTVRIGRFAPVRLAFAWTRAASNRVPLILGQVQWWTHELKFVKNGCKLLEPCLVRMARCRNRGRRSTRSAVNVQLATNSCRLMVGRQNEIHSASERAVNGNQEIGQQGGQPERRIGRILKS